MCEDGFCVHFYDCLVMVCAGFVALGASCVGAEGSVRAGYFRYCSSELGTVQLVLGFLVSELEC